MLIENKGGAGGSVGAAEAAKAAPDGYTLLMVFDTHAVNHHIYKMAPDPFKDARAHHADGDLAEHAGRGDELRAEQPARHGGARESRSRKVTYATAGAGSSNHLGALLLEQHAGIRMTHVAYKGGGPMVQALLGQQVEHRVHLDAAHPAAHQGGQGEGDRGRRQERARRCCPMCRRSSETYPGFEQISWFGILAPRGVPKQVSREGAQRDDARAARRPRCASASTERGFDVVASSPEEFLRFVQRRVRQARQADPRQQDRG